MKKGLLTISALLALSITTKVSAQVDTLNEFFTGSLGIYGVGPMPDDGYIAGNNTYGDKAKMMLFDDQYGVYSTGKIDGVLVGIERKVNAGGNFSVAIWADNNGTPASIPLVSKTFTVASIDTTTNNYKLVGDIGFYNVDVTFDTPIEIPTSRKFWAGIILPTTAGDTLNLITNTDGDFTDAQTHTGEIFSNDAFSNLKDSWGVDFAMAIFPKVNFISDAGINELEGIKYEVFPNPVNDILNFNLKENCKSIEILSLEGKSLSIENINGTTSKVNVANLTSGVYMFKLTNDKGQVSTNKFVKK